MRKRSFYALSIGFVMTISLVACGVESANTPQNTVTTTTSSVSATPTNSNSSTPTTVATSDATGGGSLVKQVTGSDAWSEGLGRPVGQDDAISQQYAEVVTVQAANYWADDWCHYYVATDGVTYGDLCIRSYANPQGVVESGAYLVYRYDANTTGHEGALLRYMNIGITGWIMYHDFVDPMFANIALVAYPSTEQNPAPENTSYLVKKADGSLEWIKGNEIVFTVPNNQSNPGLSVPAYDPSITVQAYATMTQIYNISRQIPSVIY